MGEIGIKLRTAREQKGISLHEVEEATKIRARYLEALEEEEFDILPGRAYALGFLRSYAAYLGLDVAELTAIFKRAYPQPDEEAPPVSLPAAPTRPVRTRRRLWVVVGIVILVLAGLAFLGWNSLRSGPAPGGAGLPPENPEAPPAVEEPLPEGEPPAGTPTGPEGGEQSASSPETGVTFSSPQEETFQVEVRIVGDRCWLEVQVDGTLAYSGILEGGESRYWNARQEVRIKFGLPAAARVFVNGREVGEVGGSSPVTRIFTPAGMAETGG